MTAINQNQKHQASGFVLPAVLLAILALTIIVAAIIAAAKRSNDAFVLNQSRTSSKLKIESALTIVTTGLVEDPQFWVPKQAPYNLAIGEDEFYVRLQASAGLVDINVAEPSALSRFFLLAGASQDQATSLADKIADWRDTDNLVRLAGAERDEYAASGLPRPRNGWFTNIEELGLVLGVTEEMVDCLAPFTTVDSGLAEVVGLYAPRALVSLTPTQPTTMIPALSTGSAVEIEIQHKDGAQTKVLTAIVRTTARQGQPILFHALRARAQPNREELGNCFKTAR
jgi:general secretion pathway protein K